MERKYTEDLYKKDTEDITPTVYELEPSITPKKVSWALHDLKRNKMPSCDNLPAELLQALRSERVNVLTTLCQKI